MRPTTNRQGARWTVYGLPSGYLTTRRAGAGLEPHRVADAVPLMTFRAVEPEMVRRMHSAYGWVIRSFEC